MNSILRLTPEQIESMAVEIRELLLNAGMWQDTEIYFNGKRFTSYNLEDGKYYYNDREHLIVEENQNPKKYIGYVNPDHILSMSFDGDALGMIYCGYAPEVKRQFDKIFEKYGVYYEQGESFNLTCFYIGS